MHALLCSREIVPPGVLGDGAAEALTGQAGAQTPWTHTGVISSNLTGTMRWRAAKTHRELFSEFYADLMREPLEAVLARNPAPAASVAFFERMLADIVSGGGASEPVEKASPASTHTCWAMYMCRSFCGV